MPILSVVFIYILDTQKIVLVCSLVATTQPAVMAALSISIELYCSQLFSPLWLLGDTGHVLFDFQSALHGGSRNAENICGMSIMNQMKERKEV